MNKTKYDTFLELRDAQREVAKALIHRNGNGALQMLARIDPDQGNIIFYNGPFNAEEARLIKDWLVDLFEGPSK